MRKLVRLRTPFASFILAAAAACGGGAPAGGTTAAEAEAETEADADAPKASDSLPRESAIAMLGFSGPDKPWEEMSYEEREWYMVGKVHPVMREVFANYDPRHADFHCEPCHGPDGKEKKYKMPSDHLSPVPELGSEDYQAMQGSKLVTFMREEVTAHTASLLGMEVLDPATGEGEFSCHNCHPKE